MERSIHTVEMIVKHGKTGTGLVLEISRKMMMTVIRKKLDVGVPALIVKVIEIQRKKAAKVVIVVVDRHHPRQRRAEHLKVEKVQEVENHL